MYSKIKGGSVERIDNGDGYFYECQLPPIGYGVNSVTGQLEHIGIVKNSSTPAKQYYARTQLPTDWNKRRFNEEQKQLNDLNYYDDVLLAFEEIEWKYRLCGHWFYNNGVPTYITGLHYMYVAWWKFQGRFMDYRETDRKFFYIWNYCENDPNCLGLISFTKRRQGKTAKAGIVLYEYISRCANAHGGIQSKTDMDGKIVFSKAVIQPWKKLPDFFRPKHWDTTGGDTPSETLKFFKPSQRGKKAALRKLDDDERDLESYIDYGSRKIEHYDGQPLHRYISDECGKLKDVDIVERHNTVMFCSEEDGTYVGKHLYITTVEEMEAGGAAFKTLVNMSNPKEKNKMGRTSTGLYTHFLPAIEAMYRDEFKLNKYGFADVEFAKEYDSDRRDSLRNTPSALASYIRKNPNSIREAFYIDNNKCLYNSIKLNDRLDYLGYAAKDIVIQGNFIWENGVRDSKVVFKPNKTGKFKVVKDYIDTMQSNMVDRNGNTCTPKNLAHIIGLDPFDHDTVEDNRRSNAASYVLKKNDPLDTTPYNKAFVAQYISRPPTAAIMYEDMIMLCTFFGCKMLFESQKIGIKRYFCDRGYEKFLVKLPDSPDYGIPSTPANKQTMAELTEDYIENHIESVFFEEVINDWLLFDLKNTQKYDAAMGAGYTLIGDMHTLVKKRTSEMVEITSFFRQNSMY